MRPSGLIGLVSAAALTVSVGAQQPPPATPPATKMTTTFKSSASLVAVTAAVRQPDGAAVTTLTKSDFEILDNGRPRAITSFFADEAPASLVMLFDRSGSMRVGHKTEAAREVARQVLAWLTPGRDRISLLGFDYDVARLQPFVTAPGDVLDKLANVEAFGQTSLNDAVAIAANEVAGEQTRRAVVVLTDGVDTSSRMTAASVASLAAASDVPVYVLISAVDVERAMNLPVPEGLKALSERTGGQLWVVTTPAETSMAARTIASDMHHQYLLAFEADGTPGWHSLDVRVKQKKLVVRARTGYNAGTTGTNLGFSF